MARCWLLLALGIFSLTLTMPDILQADECLEESYWDTVSHDRCLQFSTNTPTPWPTGTPLFGDSAPQPPWNPATPFPTFISEPTSRPRLSSPGNWSLDFLQGNRAYPRTYVAGLLADYREGGYGYELPLLVVRCEVGTQVWEVFVIWDEPIDHDAPGTLYHFGFDSYQRMLQLEFDSRGQLILGRSSDGRTTTTRWFTSDTNDATFLPDMLLEDFLYWLKRHGADSPAQLIVQGGVRSRGYGESAITGFWNIYGGSYVVDHLVARCGLP